MISQYFTLSGGWWKRTGRCDFYSPSERRLFPNKCHLKHHIRFLLLGLVKT